MTDNDTREEDTFDPVVLILHESQMDSPEAIEEVLLGIPTFWFVNILIAAASIVERTKLPEKDAQDE